MTGEDVEKISISANPRDPSAIDVQIRMGEGSAISLRSTRSIAQHLLGIVYLDQPLLRARSTRPEIEQFILPGVKLNVSHRELEIRIRSSLVKIVKTLGHGPEVNILQLKGIHEDQQMERNKVFSVSLSEFMPKQMNICHTALVLGYQQDVDYSVQHANLLQSAHFHLVQNSPLQASRELRIERYIDALINSSSNIKNEDFAKMVREIFSCSDVCIWTQNETRSMLQTRSTTLEKAHDFSLRNSAFFSGVRGAGVFSCTDRISLSENLPISLQKLCAQKGFKTFSLLKIEDPIIGNVYIALFFSISFVRHVQVIAGEFSFTYLLRLFFGKDIYSKELKTARNRLDRISTVVFSGIVASGKIHDTHNIVSAASRSVKSIDRTAVSQDEARRLEGISKKISAAVQNCRAILKFSDTERFDIKPVPLSMAISSVIERYSDDIQRLNISVSVSVSAAEIVHFDNDALEQIFDNLLQNSLYFLEHKQSRNRVVSITSRQSAKYTRVRFKDNGPGVKTSDRAKIFEPLFTTKGPLGNGLGLSMVRWIMRQHQGEIELLNKPGGAEFEMRFSRG